MWSDSDEGTLRSAWAKRRAGERAYEFDRRLADRLRRGLNAVQHARRRLGLIVPGGEGSDKDASQTKKATALPIGTIQGVTATVPRPAAPPEAPELPDEDLDKERSRLQGLAHRHAVRCLLRERLFDEELGRTFLSSVRRLPAPKPIVLDLEAPGVEEEPVVVISDCQIGSVMSPAYSRGISKFSKEDFARRADTFVRAVAQIVRERTLAHAVPRIRVLVLGDIIDGFGIYSSQPHELDQTIIDQIFTGVQIISNMIATWSALAPVSVHMIVGNHGKLKGPDGLMGAARDNWEFLLYKMVEKQLADNPRVAFDIVRAPFNVIDVQGWKLLLSHGDEINGGTMHANAAAAKEGLYRSMLKQDFDYWIHGDRHRHLQLETSGGEIITNGNWPGGSTLSVGRLVLNSRPSQLVLGVSRPEGISWRYKVDLDRFPAAA